MTTMRSNKGTCWLDNQVNIKFWFTKNYNYNRCLITHRYWHEMCISCHTPPVQVSSISATPNFAGTWSRRKLWMFPANANSVELLVKEMERHQLCHNKKFVIEACTGGAQSSMLKLLQDFCVYSRVSIRMTKSTCNIVAS